jgi:class 3 adenylate cyclase
MPAKTRSDSLRPKGTVTFLFTDIEGSTKLWEAHPETMRVALARHDALLREIIVHANGHVFKTVGDAFCAAFAMAPDAVSAALNAQTALDTEPWPAQTPIRVRMALYTGKVESRDRDYFGPPINRLARLLSTAHGGQTLLSQTSYDALPEAASLRDLGAHRLKDLGRPEQVYELRHPGLRGDFPPIKSLSTHANNLPQQLTTFIGREKEISQIEALLGSNRLLTLTGSGGSGKTRLGLQARMRELWAKRAWRSAANWVTGVRSPICSTAWLPLTRCSAIFSERLVSGALPNDCGRTLDCSRGSDVLTTISGYPVPARRSAMAPRSTAHGRKAAR